MSSEETLRINNYVHIGGVYIYWSSLIEALYNHVQAAKPGTIADFDANRLLSMGQHIKSDNAELEKRREATRVYEAEQRRLAAGRPEEPT